MVRRLRAGLLCALVIAASAPAAPVAAASGDKVLSRVKGSVGYQPDQNAAVKPIFGPVDVPDDAFAVTQPASRALLQLGDSSQIDIGERTTVKVGAFSMPGVTQAGNQIVLNGGALKFNIRHPAGTRSNYTFTTPTSQIAVRGTQAFLVVGPNGTQVVCVDCPPGDVTVTINGQVVALVSGQTLTIAGTTPANATYNVTPNGALNPALQQFFDTPQPLALGDPTGYTITSVTAVGAAGSALIPIALGGAVVGTLVAMNSNAATTPVPTATPTPTPAPTPTPSPTPVPFGTLMVSPTTLTFQSVPTSQPLTVQQTGPGGSISIGQPNCGGDGASASASPSNVAISPNAGPTTVTVTAQAAPTQSPPPTHSCQMTITGGGGQTATVFLDIRSTQVGINRKAATPSPSPSPTPSPAPRKTH